MLTLSTKTPAHIPASLLAILPTYSVSQGAYAYKITLALAFLNFSNKQISSALAQVPIFFAPLAVANNINPIQSRALETASGAFPIRNTALAVADGTNPIQNIVLATSSITFPMANTIVAVADGANPTLKGVSATSTAWVVTASRASLTRFFHLFIY